MLQECFKYGKIIIFTKLTLLWLFTVQVQQEAKLSHGVLLWPASLAPSVLFSVHMGPLPSKRTLHSSAGMTIYPPT